MHRRRLLLSTGAAILLIARLVGGPPSVPAASLGPNGGIRLLLHVEPFRMPPGGIQADPCTLLTPLADLADFVVDRATVGDSVRVWAYLYHPLGMRVQGVGFAIEYEGIDFVVSGSCAQLVGQDPAIMGTWPESGSEIAFVWPQGSGLRGRLAPIAWFVLRGLADTGCFRVAAGGSPFSGRVADDSMPPRENLIWSYGTIGFGQTAGELPIPDPAAYPHASGAEELRVN